MIALHRQQAARLDVISWVVVHQDPGAHHFRAVIVQRANHVANCHVPSWEITPGLPPTVQTTSWQIEAGFPALSWTMHDDFGYGVVNA
jgi:hypothetical protein